MKNLLFAVGGFKQDTNLLDFRFRVVIAVRVYVEMITQCVIDVNIIMLLSQIPVC